jgi:molecular chaperone GrpE
VIFTDKKEEHKAVGHEKPVEMPSPEEKKEISHEKVPELEAKGEELAKTKDQLIRLAAEFENYKKRAAKENEAAREKTAGDLLLKILGFVDEFEIALHHMGKSHHKDFSHGMELIYGKLMNMLKNEGVEVMKTEKEQFDPYRHDAVRQGDGDDGKIVEVVQKGYLYRGKVLRHAKVVVGKGVEKK